ncbi:MAG: hypothetical protein E7207_02325 [Clostridium butyricum]|nr:hypothetical protein [Clostridium butyricum]
MEDKNSFPIVIKKKDTLMIVAIIMELIVAANFWFINGTKICSIIFIFVAIITAISVWDESCEKINMTEFKFEVNKRNELLKSIYYEKINSLNVEKGKDGKAKKKSFLVISYFESNKKKKKADTKREKYLIDLSYYSLKDLRKIKEVITEKNSNVKITNELSNYLNRK